MLNDVVHAYKISSRLKTLSEEFRTLGNPETADELLSIAREVEPNRDNLNCMVVEPNITMCVKTRLKEAREVHGWTFGQLAKRCGGFISQSHLEKIERGVNPNTTVSKALALSYVMQVPVTTLFYLEQSR